MSVEKILSFNIGKSSSLRPYIVVVAPSGFTSHIKDALLSESKQQCSDKLQFILCEHVEEILSYNKNPPVDYIVIVMDPRDSTCITTAEDCISKIDSSFIKAGRLCLVNGACSIKPNDMGIPHGHINSMSLKYSVILINGDVLKPEKCIYLASRIIRLVSIVIGLHSGAPMSVDFPGYF